MIQNHKGKTKFILLRRTVGLAGVLCTAPALFAQTNAPTELKPVVVTGTYLESADAAGTLTVTPVQLEQPINQGFSTVADVLRVKLPQFGGPGALNPAFGNGGDGNSYVSLRGLPGNATLVLVNGRRTSTSALNLIPDAAVEKIEILNDGGSAIYGSDAVAGVVNVILKKDFQGTKLATTYGATTQSPNVNERKFQLLTGDKTEKASYVVSAEYSASDQILSPQRSPSDKSRGTSATGNPGTFSVPTDANNTNSFGVPNAIGLSWHVNPNVTRGLTNASQIPAGFNPFAVADTSGATTFDDAQAIKSATIASLNAALGPDSPVLYGPGPRFAYPAYTTLYRPHEKFDFSASAEYKLINDNVKLFTDTYFTDYKSSYQLAPSPLTGLTVPADNFWFQQVFGTDFAPGSFLTQNYRTVELGPRVVDDHWQDVRIVGGLRGEIPDFQDSTWKWEAGYLFTRGTDFNTQSGGVVFANLDPLLSSTTLPAWNPFGFTPPFGQSTVNNVSALDLGGKAYTEYIYTTQGVDFNTGGKVVDLPGGPTMIALGMAERREAFDQNPDIAVTQGLIGPYNQIPPLSANRTIWSGYGEVVIPILGKDFNVPGFSEFSVSAAARYESYDDVGDTGVKPRVSFRWKPLEQEAFSFRGSYAQGFSAPAFDDLYSPPSQNFYEIVDPFSTAPGARQQPENGVFEEGNRNLKPTESETWLAGAEYSPKFVKGLTVGADYFRIEQTGIPFKSADFIVNQWFAAGGPGNPNNPWGPNAVPSGPNPAGTQVIFDPVLNQISQINHLAAINAGKRLTDGIDFQAAKLFETDFGNFTLSGLTTWVLTWEQQDVAGAPTIDYLGRYWDSSAALPDTGYPEWRANVTLAYEFKRFNAAVGWNYVSGYTENFDGVDRSVESYMTFDVRVGYKIPVVEAELLVGVNNLFDELPPAVFSSFENNFDRAVADPRGRMVFVSLSKTF